MKKSLLIGLAAVALGSMTACSNILEEEGVISPSAKTGLLTIALEADGSVDVATKANGDVVENAATLTDEQKTQFIITATNIANTSSTSTISFNSTENVYRSAIPAGTYSVKAKYDKMNDKVLAWDAPIFEGNSSANITVEKGRQAEATIDVTLQNSQIVLDQTTFEEFEDLVNVTELYVYDTNNSTEKYSLIDSQNADKVLYVKKDQSNVKIVVKGTLDGGTQINYEAVIANTTEAAQRYVVKYSLSTENGQMKISININGNVTIKEVEIPVNPYQ